MPEDIDYVEDHGAGSAYGTENCAHCGCGILPEREHDCPKCKGIIHILCDHTCPSVDGVECPSGGPLDFAPPKKT